MIYPPRGTVQITHSEPRMHVYQPATRDLATLLRRGIHATRAIAAAQIDAGDNPDAAIHLANRGEELVEWLEQTAPAGQRTNLPHPLTTGARVCYNGFS